MNTEGHELSAEDSAELDGLFVAMPELAPPPDLVARTLAAMAAEVAAADDTRDDDAPPNVVQLPARRRAAWTFGAAAALAAAALVAISVPTEPNPAAPGTLVPRGVGGERLPDAGLKVAVSHDGSLGRLRADQGASVGDTLYFRVAVDSEAWVGLVRVDATGAQVVHTQIMAAGEADLALESGPLAWQLEPGEQDAIFALLAAPTALEAAAVEAGLAAAYDLASPDAVCQAALPLGARCSAALVQVKL
jgi:hypothetical protein